MRVKKRAFEQFNGMIDDQLAGIKHEERFLAYYDKGFNITPKIDYFDSDIREQLFSIVFNQRLLDFLGKRLEHKIRPQRDRNNAPVIQILGTIIDEDLEDVINLDVEEQSREEESQIESENEDDKLEIGNIATPKEKPKSNYSYRKSTTLKAKVRTGSPLKKNMQIELSELKKFDSSKLIRKKGETDRTGTSSPFRRMNTTSSEITNFMLQKKRMREIKESEKEAQMKEEELRKIFLNKIKRVSKIQNSISNFIQKTQLKKKKSFDVVPLHYKKGTRDYLDHRRDLSFIGLLGFKRLKEKVRSQMLQVIVTKAIKFQENDLDKNYKLFKEKLQGQLRPKKRKASVRNKGFDNFFLSLANKKNSSNKRGSVSRGRSKVILSEYDEMKIATEVKKLKKASNKKKLKFYFVKDFLKSPKQFLKINKFGNFKTRNAGTQFVLNFTKNDAFYLILAFFFCLRNNREIEAYAIKKEFDKNRVD